MRFQTLVNFLTSLPSYEIMRDCMRRIRASGGTAPSLAPRSSWAGFLALTSPPSYGFLSHPPSPLQGWAGRTCFGGRDFTRMRFRTLIDFLTPLRPSLIRGCCRIRIRAAGLMVQTRLDERQGTRDHRDLFMEGAARSRKRRTALDCEGERFILKTGMPTG